MAITELTATEAVGATEHSLATDTSYDTGDAQTTDGILQAWLDVSDMGGSDELQIRVYEKCQSSSTQRVCYESILHGSQYPTRFYLPSLMVMHGWDVTVKALTGTITINSSLRLSAASITETTGTETVGTTEWSLFTGTSYDVTDLQTTDIMVQAFIDGNAIAGTDAYLISLYEKVRSGDTAGIARQAMMGPSNAPLHVLDVPIVLHGYDLTLKKLTGTDRAIDWSLRKVSV